MAYFSVGVKTSYYLFQKNGKQIYLLYGLIAMPLFSYLGVSYALLLMSLSGAGLLILNLTGIYRLRKQVIFVQDIGINQELTRENKVLLDQK